MMAGMSTMVNEQQLAAIKTWAAGKVDLNGIQKKLQSEFGLHLTYMEVRFLMLDHGIELVTETEKEGTPAASSPDAQQQATQETPPVEQGGKVRVELDDLQLPGTLLSGKAHFPGGAEGAWQSTYRHTFPGGDAEFPAGVDRHAAPRVNHFSLGRRGRSDRG